MKTRHSGEDAPAAGPDWSVAVPTRATREALARIGTGIIAKLDGLPATVVLNDSAMPSPEPAWSKSAGVHILRAPGGGVARARNAVLDLAPTRFVVFVDDDVIVTRAALELLVATLRRGDAAVATARVLAAAATDGATRLHGGPLAFDRGTEHRTWRFIEEAPAVSPFSVWDFGVGAAFAVDLVMLGQARPVPGFDERLSNGRFCGGSEDSDFFFQAYRAGLAISYVADAVVYHEFPEGWAALRRKCRQYALSDGAFYAKWRKASRPSDFIKDGIGWAARMRQQIADRLGGRDAVPFVSLAAEPAYKAIGGAYWLARHERWF